MMDRSEVGFDNGTVVHAYPMDYMNLASAQGMLTDDYG